MRPRGADSMDRSGKMYGRRATLLGAMERCPGKRRKQIQATNSTRSSRLSRGGFQGRKTLQTKTCSMGAFSLLYKGTTQSVLPPWVSWTETLAPPKGIDPSYMQLTLLMWGFIEASNGQTLVTVGVAHNVSATPHLRSSIPHRNPGL